MSELQNYRHGGEEKCELKKHCEHGGRTDINIWYTASHFTGSDITTPHQTEDSEDLYDNTHKCLKLHNNDSAK